MLEVLNFAWNRLFYSLGDKRCYDKCLVRSSPQGKMGWDGNGGAGEALEWDFSGFKDTTKSENENYIPYKILASKKYKKYWDLPHLLDVR